MGEGHEPDWAAIRARAALIAPAAFGFVVDGLRVAVERSAKPRARGGDDAGMVRAVAEQPRHVTGQQLSLALRDLAVAQYGMMAGTVLRHWNVRETADFGVIVYAMIERGEMRRSADDRFEDFVGVYAFDEAFGAAPVRSS
jgi:uncharacterized repeat protein (TIGR04138 family)